MTRLSIHVDGLIYAKQAHGGISRNFTNLMNALARRDDTEVHLHLPGKCESPEALVGVHCHNLPQDINWRPSRFFRRASLSLNAYRTRKYWASIRDGIFHSSFYSSPNGVAVPQVLSMQDTIFEDYPELFDLPRHHQHIVDKRLAAERCAGLVFSSVFAKDRTLALYDIGRRPVLVAAYAIDPLFKGAPVDADIAAFRSKATGGRPYILHVGSRHRHKNVVRLIEAYSRWDGNANFDLLLAGGGELSEDEACLVSSLGMEGRVKVIPRMSDADVVAAYHAATAMVFPSLSEGFGFPVLEALACACPVACSKAASLPEVGGRFPVYFDPTDIDSILSSLSELMDSCGDALRWQQARTAACARSWDDVAADYMAFYQGLSS